MSLRNVIFQFYRDAKEAIPMNAPEPQVKDVDSCMFVYSDHSGDKVSCISRSGALIYVNTTSVQWFSKEQSTGEISVFGAKFVTMKQGIDALRNQKYMLRMMGIPISGPSYIDGDHMSVVRNISKPESVLRKKSNPVCYHAVHESVALGVSLVEHITSKENVADLMTKVLYR